MFLKVFFDNVLGQLLVNIIMIFKIEKIWKNGENVEAGKGSRK